MKVPREVLNRADHLTSRASRLTANTSPKVRYLSVLHAIRRVLMEQVLLEVARIPLAVQLAVTRAAKGNLDQKQRAGHLFPEISDLPDELVPNALQGWAEPIRKFRKKHPFDKNVFIMVSYRSELAPLIRRVKQELIDLDLNPVIARDHNLTDDLNNPIACLLCCSFGVAIFGRAEATQMHNPNVVYELGMMHLLKRPLYHSEALKTQEDANRPAE